MPKIRYVPTISIIIGIYWLYMGVANYGFWSGVAPGAGFFPAVIGALLIGFSLWIFKSPAVLKQGALQKRAFYPVFAAILSLVCVYLIGFVLAMGIMVILWLYILEKYSLIKSLTIGVCATIFIYFVFKIWLMVPFPKGLLGII